MNERAIDDSESQASRQTLEVACYVHFITSCLAAGFLLNLGTFNYRNRPVILSTVEK
jgi:hypothetical protein